MITVVVQILRTLLSRKKLQSELSEVLVPGTEIATSIVSMVQSATNDGNTNVATAAQVNMLCDAAAACVYSYYTLGAHSGVSCRCCGKRVLQH